MANFALNSNDPYSDVISSVNYLLATQGTISSNTSGNTGNTLVANANTGQITTTATSSYLSYLYPYLHIRYATSATGSTGFSTSPTNATYFGVQNSTSLTGSSSPADYQWTQVSGGGFGTTKFLFYQVFGGRQIQYNISTAAPFLGYVQAVDATPVNLDYITSVANVVITANNVVASTLTGNQIAANTVATTNITANAISDFGGAFTQSAIIRYSPTANIFYNISGNVTITATVPKTKISIASQALVSYYTNVNVAGATVTSNTVIRMTEVATGNIFILNYLEYLYTFLATGIALAAQDIYILTGYTTTLANAGSYVFATYNKYEISGNADVYVSDINNRGILVQALKR